LNKRKIDHWKISLTAGAIILFGILFCVAAAPFIAKHDPAEQNASIRLEGPSSGHLFGTDNFGRDIFARTLYGGKTTLTSTVAALTIALLLGLFVGLLTGVRCGKVVDIVVMRLIDVLMSFPFIALAMVITALFGASLFHLLFIVALVWWVPFARLTRSIVIQTRGETSIEAAKVLGARTAVIAIRELLPRTIAPVLIQATFELGNLVLSISALSFLGLGAQPPTPEWGSMLADGRAYFFQSPHVLFGPALFIVLTVLALNLIGEGLRDYLDPYEIIKL
jgi:peptide/nickel transport system permease protein